ncbi:hypothetical protein EHS25_006124 [Saitozyma podzolica]|uniref:Peptidase M24 domain-containing protein n=1 Tax=Saitozyma podzolica TaxID=1890683 RepID=A0A427XTY1_9TREE|nr:hypothetical protein EHS25_006124 [Saitozyma podzolica]
MLLPRLLSLLSLLMLVAASMPVAKYRPLPSLREQDAMEKKWVEKRHRLIPKILRAHGYDAWIITMREYAEDTVFRSLVSTTTTFSARRRTLFLFHTHPNITSPIHLVDNKPEIWDELNRVLDAIQPERIAVNIDEDMAFSDGLHTGEGRLLTSKLDTNLMMENVWAMVQEGFSEQVVQVGKTTAEDLEWWFRDVMRWRIGTGTWFPPTVDIYRSPSEPSLEQDPHMREGDMLHVDIGITAMGMNTDTQHLGYILRANETSPPRSLVRGLHRANRMQDMNRREMVPGRTGDEVFFAVKRAMKNEGLEGDVYSHPIGDYGHSAGAIIGMANWQDSIPGGGQNKVLKHYWTSVELAGFGAVPEWGVEKQRFELEEDVYWQESTNTFEWVFGQQTEFHLVQPKKGGDNNPKSDLGTSATSLSLVEGLGKLLGWHFARWL